MEILLVLLLIVMTVITTVLWLKSRLPEKHPVQMINTDNAHVHVVLKQLKEDLIEMPNKMLQSIIGSTNTHKGALGELIGYIQLRASYDRIIPLGNIVDFLAINFPKDGTPGKIVFIDVKTGDKARLSKDQKQFQKLIEEKRIEFQKFKIDSVQFGGEESGGNDPKE